MFIVLYFFGQPLEIQETDAFYIQTQKCQFYVLITQQKRRQNKILIKCR